MLINNLNLEENATVERKGKTPSLSTKKRNQLIFYCAMMALPVLQFCCFYFYVNFNSFLLGFQKLNDNGIGYKFVGFANFKDVFEIRWDLLITNSLLYQFFSLFVGMFGTVLFSYYIYKKNPGHSIFKVILYSPSIISGVVFALLFNYFIDKAIPAIVGDPNMIPPMSNPEYQRGLTIFFVIWAGFGGNILLYTGAMSGISESLIESAQLDGITAFKELFLIVLPSIWGTFVTFILMSIMGIFTNQGSLFAFFGTEADPELQTIGYYLYANLQKGTQQGSVTDYNRLAAMGMVLTVVAVPLSLTARYLLNKFGPKTE